jgi:zinc protease
MPKACRIAGAGRIAAVALWGCAAAAAAVHAAAGSVAPSTGSGREASPFSVAPIAFTERRLANGLQVITVPNRASPTVSVQVWYHVGSKDDPPGRSGFAHLFEHLMFKSTKHLKNEQFDRLTEDVGGSNNAFTNNDVTAYQDLVPSNHLEVLLWAEAERMSNLNVDEANFRSERAVVEEEFRERILASPYGRLMNALPGLTYQTHPYARPTIGRVDDLEAASLDDVVAFHRTHYRPDNATLVVAGDFDPAQLDAWVDLHFGAIPRPASALSRASTVETPWRADRRADLTAPQVPLPAVVLAWLGPPADSPDVPALQVASALLSGGESGRLNQALVYRQRLASSASFDFDQNAGPGLLTAMAVAAGKRPLPDVQAALWAELQRLARGPIPPAELAKVKTQAVTAALLSRQTPEGLANAVASAAVIQSDASRVNADMDALQQVTAEDVKRVMRRYVLDARKVEIRYTQALAAVPATPVAAGQGAASGGRP